MCNNGLHQIFLLPSLVDCAPSLSSGTTRFIVTELITLSFLTLPVLTLATWIASYFLDLCPDWSTEQNLHKPVMLAFFSLRCLCTNLTILNLFPLLFCWCSSSLLNASFTQHWKSSGYIKSGPVHGDYYST